MLDLIDKKTSTLRGGGCGASRQSPNTYQSLKSDIQDMELFITRFDSYVSTICSKATVVASQQESQEIMIAIQWFVFQEEIIDQLSKDGKKVKQTYNLIIQGIRNLLKSCLIYIKVDQFKCFYILQITTSLSKVIFRFHLMNDDRLNIFMDVDLQREFLELSEELKQQMQIEKTDLIQVQLKLYLFLTKTSFEIAPININQRKDILEGCVTGIIISIAQMKPSGQFLEALFQGACLIYNMPEINKIRTQYEAYFQIDMLQWEIVSYFKNENESNLEEFLNTIEAIHENLVKKSKNWINHYLWIQMIGKIQVYNPLITKQKLYRLASQYKLGSNSSQIWKEYQKKGLIIQMNHSTDQAVIQLNQYQNKQLLQIDRIILENFYKQAEQFIQLKDFMLNEQNINKHFTFRSYLQNKLYIGIDTQENQNTVEVVKIELFFDLIVPNKLLTLVLENYEKLGLVQKTYGKFIVKNSKYNEKIQQNVKSQQMNKMIFRLKECYENTQNITKIIRLNSRKCNDVIEQKDLLIKLLNCQNLKYSMKVLEQIISQIIQGFKDNSHDQENKSFIQNQYHDEIMNIHGELTQLQLKNSCLDNLKRKLQPLLVDSIKQKEFLKIAQNLIQFITNSWKELEKIEKQEISSLQTKSLLIEFIKIQLNNLYLEYNEFVSELKNYTDESILLLEQIIQIKYEINIENGFINQIKKLRFKHLRLYYKLDNIKKSFSNILAKTNKKDLQNLWDLINLDEFLFSVIKDYPIKMNCQKRNIDKKIIELLAGTQFNQQDYQNKLSNQKLQIEYFNLYLSIEEQTISSQLQDLELIEKEFSDIYMDESSYYQSMDKIIQSLSKYELLEYVSKKDVYLSEQELQKQKRQFENCLSELKKIKDQSNYQNSDKIQIVDQLTKLIEKIIKTLGTFGILDKEIFLILIKEELNILKNVIEQNDKTEKQKQSNQNEEIQSQQQIQQQNENSVVQQNYKKIHSFRNENCHTYLLYMIKVVQQQLQRIKEEKELLHNLFQDIINFSDNLDLIHSHNEDLQNQCFEIFQNRFKEFKTSYEKLITIINLQYKEDEKFEDYFERISANLQKGVNDNLQKGENDIEIIQPQQQYISDFLNSLQGHLQEKLRQAKYFSNTSINQEFLIQQIKKLYFLDNQEDDHHQSNQELGLVDNLKQRIQDYWNDNQWKIKQGLVFTIIQISSNCFTDSSISFCQNTLIQLWVKEKDQRVRNLLKNEKLINLQMQILKKDWQSQHDRVAGEMQQMLKKIDELSEQISHEANPNERDLKLKEMDETTQQLDEYIENISEMGQKLTLMTDFVNHIRKNLLRVEGKINEIKDQLNTVGNDVKFLRGKSVNQLLEIRKWKVLKEAAYRNVKSIYLPLKTQEKEQEGQSNLINLEQLEDKEGEVNEFLLEEKETVMLIHGIAGSGKSTTAKKIEEFIWKLHEEKKKIRNVILIPVYISLPQLKNPVFQAVEETLLQDDYGFENLQLKECKQKLENNEFRFLLIMDSYDEMKLENIQKNLYLTNKLKSNWQNPLVIFTTRSEIFTSNNYRDWFMPEGKQMLKEIQLLKFNNEQIKEYLKQFTILSIKMLIFDTYEFQMQIEKRSIDINKFELFWKKLLQTHSEIEGQNIKSDLLLNPKQIQSLLEYLKDDEFIALKNNEALRSLGINFEKLWSIQKYENIMKQINSNKLVETPYMMEIMVQVLPYMMTKAQDIIQMKQNFIKNFSKMLKDFLKSNYLIEMYKQQQKQHLIELNNQIQEEQFIVTHSDVQYLKKIDYHQVSLIVWEELEKNSITKQLQISQDLLDNLDVNVSETNLSLQQNTYDKGKIKKESIISLVVDALKQYNLTSFDFYSEFINYHYLRQIQKKKNLGKSMNIDRFLMDLQFYSIELAKLMSKNQITQVQYKYQGLLFKKEGEEEQLDKFFNDDDKNGSYVKDIRSCSLVQKKGANFSFVHKSIQEFLIAASLYDLLVLAKDLDVQTLRCVINRFQTEQNQDQDSMKFLKELDLSLLDIKVNNLPLFERQQEQVENKKKMELIINLIQQIKKHDFNLINYSSENYTETRKYLIQKISQDSKIIELLKFLVQITKIDQSLIQSGSNSINLLVEMKVNLTMINFQNISIKNTSILGGNFVKCNLSGSKFENVNINGINLNGAQLFNCIWKNLRLNELFQLDGHSHFVSSVCFSPDGTILASGSYDNSIRLWDVKTGQLKSQLDGHSSWVSSVCFSPDGTILASGSEDKSIRLWDVKTGQLKSQLDGHSSWVSSVCFSPDGTILASGSYDKSIRLWDVKTGQLKSQLVGHSHEVNSVCFSPDGTILASGSVDKSIRLWDVKTGQLKSQLDGHSHFVSSVCFSPDGTILASGSYDKSIRLWDVKTGQLKSQLVGHSHEVNSVCFSPDGTILASGSVDKSIRLWDVKTGQLKSQLDGHSSWVSSVCFSPDGTILASGSSDQSIRLWDVKTGQQISQLDGHSSFVLSICFSPDGTLLASGSDDQSIRLWDVKTGQLKSQLVGHSNAVRSVCFSPDGTILASGSVDKSIRLWDVKTGQLKSQLDGHSSWVSSVCFSPDGTILASGSEDKSIRLWDVKTGQLKSQLDGHSRSVYSVCFSPDGTILASGSLDNSIRLWDVKNGQLKYQLDGHSHFVSSVCFSPDGTILASGSYDKSIRLWEVKTGQLKYQLDGHSSAVSQVCFSPDGTILASGSHDNSIRLWEVKTGQLKYQLDGHIIAVSQVCFSPDGTILASGSYDKSIRLWDVKTGQLKSQLDGHSDRIRSFCFSPDGTLLASRSRDKSIRLRDVKTGEQIEPQEKKYTDILTYFQAPLHQNSHLAKDTTSNIAILIINQQPLFQAQSTLILKGQFYNQLGIDLKKLFIEKGCCILDKLI